MNTRVEYYNQWELVQISDFNRMYLIPLYVVNVIITQWLPCVLTPRFYDTVMCHRIVKRTHSQNPKTEKPKGR